MRQGNETDIDLRYCDIVEHRNFYFNIVWEVRTAFANLQGGLCAKARLPTYECLIHTVAMFRWTRTPSDEVVIRGGGSAQWTLLLAADPGSDSMVRMSAVGEHIRLFSLTITRATDSSIS